MEPAQISKREKISDKDEFRGSSASIQTSDLAFAAPLRGPDEGPTLSVKNCYLTLGKKGVDGKFLYVSVGNAEKFQGLRIRGDNTVLAVGDHDRVERACQQALQLIFPGPR